VLAGGADERSSEALGALERADLLCRGTTPPIPYHAERTGFALGEGAALVMLEAADLAATRSAAVRAEVRGHASGNASSGDNEIALVDAFVAEIIGAALADAGAVARDIDAVSASASGSIEVDACEARALAMALCPGGRSVPVMAVKSVLGEVLGASGTLQVIAILEAARYGCVPGISGLEDAGVETTCLDLRAGARPVRVNTALINAIGWDGNCCALVVDATGAR
jgi:3-oxoacyl-(acyl-carrier-protein) synthase